jgi:GT2 family glycosyltransferase
LDPPGRKLAAVVLNYRTADDTAIAVSSLLASNRAPDQVLVVDNDETGECRARLAKWEARVSYLSAGRNLGFSGGMNVGIRAALEGGADRVLLVNSDAVVPPDCLARLEDALDRGCGVAGPLVLSRAMPDVVASAGIDYDPRMGRMRHRDVGAIVDGRTWTDGPRDAVSGCVLLVSRAVFDRIGLLDERYFFAFEEIDFCLRAREAGFTTRLVANARVYHEGGRAIGADSPRRLYFAARNHLLMASRVSPRDGLLTRTGRALVIAALNLAHAVRAPGGTVASRLGATTLGIRDHLRGRYGAGPLG